MKNILLSIPLIMLAGTAMADTTIVYPQDKCVEIVGTDYSAPGGDSSTYIFELLCKDAEGTHRVFVTTWKTTGAFFGLGRAAASTVITLEPGDVTNLVKR